MPRCRFSGGSFVTSCPAISIVPLVGDSSPAMQRSSVVLPQPDGPSSETNSPDRIERSMPLSTFVPLKSLVSEGDGERCHQTNNLPRPMMRSRTIMRTTVSRTMRVETAATVGDVLNSSWP